MATVATPTIFTAAKEGDYDAVRSFLPAEVSSVNETGRSALSLAAAAGHTKIVKALLDAGATDSAVAGWTAVHHAAFKGHSEVLSAIVTSLGAGSVAPSAGGMPPLLLAALKGNVTCLTALLDAAPASLNEAVDAHGRTALMCAASGGSAEAVELLASRGANLDAISSDGKTALMWAVAGHKPQTLVALARLGADPTIAAPLPDVVVPGQDRSKGETAEDLSNAKHARDPTLRMISTYMEKWRLAREAGEGPPDMFDIPWVSHAHAFKAKEEAAAAEAAAKADEPLIEEVATAAADGNDIFGDDDAATMVADVTDDAPTPVGGDAELKHEAEEAQKAVAADADLDELD